ncbi:MULTISPECIES: DUF746 domain-containing protein [unclassified Burkholderia]|uniref:DUF746 domain-containing protein n=1 Tax=unclassified Burkholderia TaxID=2613784 RepID=UPI0021AB0EFF|nr:MULTISPECIES: DUF746 domain-containing protein [unclassified Burkholderia]
MFQGRRADEQRGLHAWLLQLNPRGTWEQRVRLGGRSSELNSAPLVFDEIGAGEGFTLTARL